MNFWTIAKFVGAAWAVAQKAKDASQAGYANSTALSDGSWISRVTDGRGVDMYHTVDSAVGLVQEHFDEAFFAEDREDEQQESRGLRGRDSRRLIASNQKNMLDEENDGPLCSEAGTSGGGAVCSASVVGVEGDDGVMRYGYVTAQHCIDSDEYDSTRVSVPVGESRDIYYDTGLWLHPGYVRFNGGDVAILFDDVYDREVANVACHLLDSSVTARSQVVITGRLGVNENTDFSSVSSPSDVCDRQSGDTKSGATYVAPSGSQLISDKWYTTNSNGNEYTICPGNSGGGVFLTVNGVEYHVAVISWASYSGSGSSYWQKSGFSAVAGDQDVRNAILNGSPEPVTDSPSMAPSPRPTRAPVVAPNPAPQSDGVEKSESKRDPLVGALIFGTLAISSAVLVYLIRKDCCKSGNNGEVELTGRI